MRSVARVHVVTDRRFLVAAAISALLLAACAHGGDRDERGATAPDRAATAPRGAAGSASGGETGNPGPPPREISTDRALAEDAGAGTETRAASQRVVEEGKGYLIARRPADAARRFDQATRIDPTNGFAYYYLGRARADQGDRSGAIGVLEKAESLLGPYPEWRERAARLIESLRGD